MQYRILNQLCYDGKSYAVAYNLPILTDYTIIADRTWFAEKVDNGVFMSKSLEQNGAFILEYKQGDKWNTYSYYSATNINIDKDNSIVYQTKNKYNEQNLQELLGKMIQEVLSVVTVIFFYSIVLLLNMKYLG